MNVQRLFLAVLLCFASQSQVLANESAGKIIYQSGTVSALRADGSVKIMAQKSDILPGDTLSTEKDSYAQINFSDGSSATLRPNSSLKIESYSFKPENPQSDNLFFRLVKGGLRTVTGLIGKRGNQDAYKLGTSTATIGIRGSSGDTLECSAGCVGVLANSDNLPPGTYHTTYTGGYVMKTNAGEQLITEGKFGFSQSINSPPVILPNNPGLNLNSLPFTLGVNPTSNNPAPGNNPANAPAQECVVR